MSAGRVACRKGHSTYRVNSNIKAVEPGRWLHDISPSRLTKVVHYIATLLIERGRPRSRYNEIVALVCTWQFLVEYLVAQRPEFMPGN